MHRFVLYDLNGVLTADVEERVPIMLLARACKLCYSNADNQRTIFAYFFNSLKAILQLLGIDVPLAVVLKQSYYYQKTNRLMMNALRIA